MTVSKELSKYKLDLVGVQEVRWEGGGTESAGEYTFFYGNDNENHELGACFFVHQRIKIRFPNPVLRHYTQHDNIHETWLLDCAVPVKINFLFKLGLNLGDELQFKRN
jgi:hypothetical protein